MPEDAYELAPIPQLYQQAFVQVFHQRRTRRRYYIIQVHALTPMGSDQIMS